MIDADLIFAAVAMLQCVNTVMCVVVNSSSSSSSTTSSSVSSAVSECYSVSASVCPASAALMTHLNAAHAAGDVRNIRTAPVDKGVRRQTMAADQACAVSECQPSLALFDTDRKSLSSLPANQSAAADSRRTQPSFPPSQAFVDTDRKSLSLLPANQSAAADSRRTQPSFPPSQAFVDTDRKSLSSLPASQSAAADSRRTQPSFLPSQAFQGTFQKSQSSLLTGQAVAFADTQISSHLAMSNFSSMETGESQPLYGSVDTAAVSERAATGASQSDAAENCKSAVVSAAASVSRVCTDCCVIRSCFLYRGYS